MQHSSWVGFGLKSSLCYQAWQKNCSKGLILWMESIPDLCETQFVFQLSRETGPSLILWMESIPDLCETLCLQAWQRNWSKCFIHWAKSLHIRPVWLAQVSHSLSENVRHNYYISDLCEKNILSWGWQRNWSQHLILWVMSILAYHWEVVWLGKKTNIYHWHISWLVTWLFFSKPAHINNHSLLIPSKV